VDWPAAAGVWAAADLGWLAAAVLLSLTSFVPAALRWKRLLAAVHLQYPLLAAYRTYLVGVFCGLAMPGVIVGGSTATGIPRWLPAVGVLFLAALLALPRCLRWLDRSWTDPASARGSGGATLLGRLRATIGALRDIRVTDLLLALALSIGFQLIDIVVVQAIGRALAVDLGLPTLLVTMPLVYLATVLPLSPGGLGVREGTMAFVLAQSGVSAPAAALLALTVFLNRVLVGAVGGLAYLAGGRIRPDDCGDTSSGTAAEAVVGQRNPPGGHNNQTAGRSAD